MKKNLYILDYDVEGQPVLDDIELKCVQALKKDEEEIIAKKEAVLKAQTDFRVELQCYNNAKKELNFEFDRFCAEKFKAPLPNLQTESVEVLIIAIVWYH